MHTKHMGTEQHVIECETKSNRFGLCHFGQKAEATPLQQPGNQGMEAGKS